MNKLFTVSALFALSSSCYADEPLVAVCRVTGNTKGPPRVQLADARVVVYDTHVPADLDKLPACSVR